MVLDTRGLNTFLVSIGTLIILSLSVAWFQKYKKKRDEQKLREKVLSSPDTSWQKVAKVSELYCYPLKSAKAKSIEECYFGEYGITMDGIVRNVEDRMFIIYDEETQKSVTANKHKKLLIVKLSFMAENRAKLEVNGIPSLEFDLPNYKSKRVSITMWIGEVVDGIDCGPEPSKWLSRYLYDSESGVRLAMRIPGLRRNVTQGPWKAFAKAYSKLRNDDSGLFAYLASYMLLSADSMNDLNNRMENQVPPIQMRPNIVVKGCEPYAEDDWEWIKIGDQAIIRNFKPCTRCTMTTVDPETGIADPKGEPLKTLRSYRKLKDPALHKLEWYSPPMGIYCGLYSPGFVRIDDDVYIYKDDKKSTDCIQITALKRLQQQSF